jgi:hypothetical protein
MSYYYVLHKNIAFIYGNVDLYHGLQAAAAQAGISAAASVEIEGFGRGSTEACPEQQRYAECARTTLASLAVNLIMVHAICNYCTVGSDVDLLCDICNLK